MDERSSWLARLPVSLGQRRRRQPARPIGSELGRLLRDLRAGAHLSQRELALRARVDPATVNLLEQGRRHASRAVVRRLWLAVNGEADDLDRLLAAAGLLPESVVEAGGWDAYLRLWRGNVAVLERKLELRDAALIDQGRRLAGLLGAMP